VSQKEAEKDTRGKSKLPGTRENGGDTSLWRRVMRLSPSIFWILAVFLATFAVFFASLVPPQVRLKAGEVAPFDIKAPQEVIDDIATERLKNEKIQSIPKAYDNDPKVLTELTSLLRELRMKIDTVSSSSNLSTQDIVNALRPFADQTVSDADVLAVVAASPEVLDFSFQKAQEIAQEVLSPGLKPENLEKGKETINERLGMEKDIPNQVGRFLSAFFSKNLKPNMILNQEETDRKVREAIAGLEPVKIRRGQFIVKEGDIVSPEQIALMEKLGMMGSRIRLTSIAGSVIMALVLCGFISSYLYTYYSDITSQRNSALAASVVILSILALKAMSEISGFLAPVAFGVMLTSTLIDRRFGAFFGACLVVATGVITGFDHRYAAVSLVAGLSSSLSVRKVWNRSQLFKAGLISSLVATGTYLALGLTGAIALGDVLVWRDVMFVLLQGPVSAVLAVGSLPLFESLFSILTPIKLIELSNPEHPLLHRLLLEAPGTYHHSIMVGNLAEAAAWAVGADSLLARVGAYYHDVGKIKRPYLFAENQVFGMDNPHDRMSPSLSSTVIISHVKDGLELAREHKVPEAIQRFIAEHHGTTLASYFYAKASENTGKNGRQPEERDFRYEGPRPGTKETAIVMLADSVEAAARSLSKPTPSRIESLVRKIIHDRLFDHQLDRSNLTLRELDTVAETFVRVLTGIFHTRIEYPSQASGEKVSGQNSGQNNGPSNAQKTGQGSGQSDETGGKR